MKSIFGLAAILGTVLIGMTVALAQDKQPQNAAAQPTVIRRPYFMSRIVHHEPPVYPEEAKATNASGPVEVEVTVDENGVPLEAHAISGDPLLRAAAENNAMKTRWEPLQDRRPIRATGKLTINFPRPDEKPIRKRVIPPPEVFSNKEESRLLRQLDQTPDLPIKYDQSTQCSSADHNGAHSSR